MHVLMLAQKEPKRLGLSTYADYLSSELRKIHVSTDVKYVEASNPIHKMSQALRFGSDADMIHFTVQGLGYMNFFKKLKKSVTTVHDLFGLDKNRSFLDYWTSKISLKAALKNGHVITNSYYVRNQLSGMFSLGNDRLHTIYLGVDQKIFKPNKSGTKKIREKYEGKKILLCVGSEEPRKNMSGLLAALKQLKDKQDFVLLKAGVAGWPGARQAFVKKAEELGVQDRIEFLDYVSDEKLAQLYNTADVLVFPSKAEGFGRPPLEAMASGCPVVASNTTAIPEVTGDAAVLVDPNNSEAMANAINNVLENSTLRKGMIKKGLQRSKQFTWKATAEKTKEVYEVVSHG